MDEGTIWETITTSQGAETKGCPKCSTPTVPHGVLPEGSIDSWHASPVSGSFSQTVVVLQGFITPHLGVPMVSHR